MPKGIGAHGTGIDTTGKAANLAVDLDNMFVQFIKDAEAAAGGEWTGMAKQAFHDAQIEWRQQAAGLSSALAQASAAAGRNIGELLETDHQWSKTFQA